MYSVFCIVYSSPTTTPVTHHLLYYNNNTLIYNKPIKYIMNQRTTGPIQAKTKQRRDMNKSRHTPTGCVSTKHAHRWLPHIALQQQAPRPLRHPHPPLCRCESSRSFFKWEVDICFMSSCSDTITDAKKEGVLVI